MNTSFVTPTGVKLLVSCNNPSDSIYLDRLVLEFFLTELSSSTSTYDIYLSLGACIPACSTSTRVFKEPSYADNQGVFFKDSSGHIARIDFMPKDFGVILSANIESGFDESFFYIICLYLISVCSTKYGFYYIHAACLSRNNQLSILAAWRHTGKTSLVIQALEDHNYSLIADDGIFIDSNMSLSPTTKTLQYVYYNILQNPKLFSSLSSQAKSIFNTIKDVSSSPLVENRTSNHLNSLFRYRFPISPEPPQLIQSSTIAHVFSIIPSDFFSHQSIISSTSSVVNSIVASSMFELRYFFDLYMLFKSSTGLANSLFETYEYDFTTLVKRILDNTNHSLETPASVSTHITSSHA